MNKLQHIFNPKEQKTMKNTKTNWQIVDMYTGRSIGYVEAISWRSARLAAGKKFPTEQHFYTFKRTEKENITEHLPVKS